MLVEVKKDISIVVRFYFHEQQWHMVTGLVNNSANIPAQFLKTKKLIKNVSGRVMKGSVVTHYYHKFMFDIYYTPITTTASK